jgi:AcrR family transcriptional regulator
MVPKARKRSGRKTSYHHRALRQALIAAALDLVADKGPSGFSLREASRRIGVTPAAPYRHFRDRAALLAAVAEEGFHALERAMAYGRDRAPASDPVARFEAIGHAYVRFAVSHPSHFRAMFSPDAAAAGGASLANARGGAFAVLEREIAEGQRRGLLRGTRPADVALPAWAIVHGLAALLVDRVARAGTPRGGAAAQAARVTRALLDGVARAGR